MRNKFIILVIILFSVSCSAQNFSTKENGIRNCIIANVKGNNVFYLSELSGGVSSYTLEGKNLWRNATDEEAVLFEINAVDVNEDGNDDLIAASGDGNIYCWDSNGSLLWKFTPEVKVRFSEVAVVNNRTIQIFAGGNNNKLYELDSKGKLVSTTPIKGVVRKIEAGRFTGDGKQSLFVYTYNHDKFRWEFMGFIDAETKEVIKSVSLNDKRLKELRKAMVTDVEIADINGDSKDDILFFGDVSFKALVVGLDSDFNVIVQFQASNKDTQRYAHSQGTFLPKRNEIMFQNGGILFVLDSKGKLIAKSGERYGAMVYNDFVFEPKSNQLIAAGEVDGGNTLYFYDVSKNNWWNTTHKMQGRMLEVEKNIDKLYQQTLMFTPPSYQKKSDEDWVMITSKEIDSKVKKLKGQDIKFVIQKAPKEGTDRSHLVAKIGKTALKKDKRGKYQETREEIVQMARDYEAQGQPFTFWAGHGNDPFYIQIETLEKILEVAPTTCYGFVYAEMANVDDPRVVHFVKEYLPRLAKAIRKNNRAKLYFRYKNMFWAATSHLPLWKEMFFSGKYSDILIPASEDTSNRIQDLNLAGRVGMMSGGYVNDFAMRLVDDNPTSWRPLTPGGQNSISPYLRQGVVMAAYGARYGIIIDNNFTKGPGLNVLFALMKSGVLPVVEKENIQSIGSWHLIKEVDAHLIHSVDDHHNLKHYKKDDDNAVFSVGQMHWAGASVPEYDFSNAALGVKYRWLNYMPIMPYGMVPVAPIESEKLVEGQNKPYFVSNAKVGFVNGEKIEAKQFGSTITKTVKEGADKLPIIVEGASWSAVKIDDNHTRLILVDPGYINPQERKVVVIFQHRKPKSATDILSNETVEIINNTSKFLVPAGSIRFIDIAY
ncbi:PQQ-binding-like beta-propeller repeat protein [Lutibacter citreus]|uniref:PQQ-binding-like beta-propeller repeat protein n=1 Tax=Lutibacter citreus TaxID=2138210 RepID=UPI000DBE48FE|nr:PQQ-binding-like beta-propeller repeat protein [Lutibacter citreus]